MRGWKDIRLTRFRTAGLWGDVDDVILSHRKEIDCNVALGQLVLSKSQRMLFAGTADQARSPFQNSCTQQPIRSQHLSQHEALDQ